MDNNKHTMILHVDADAFFVACEVARLPHLKGTPVVVGEERGIACAMNYEAKALGIVRGTPIFKIRKSFPQVTVLSSHFELYREYQDHLVRILRARFMRVEVYSIDECFVEVTPLELSYTHKSLNALKKEIETAIGINYTFGLARTKTLAKLASSYAKPNGAKVVFPYEEEGLLKATPIGKIWGVGYRSVRLLEKLGIATAYDLVLEEDKDLVKKFAIPILRTKHELQGRKEYDISDGTDDQKSLQVTRSFAAIEDTSFALSELSLNITHACRRLRALGMLTKHVFVYIKKKDALYGNKYGDKKVWYECKLAFETQSEQTILEGCKTFIKQIENFEKGVFRGSGVWMMGLVPNDELREDLFGASVLSRADDTVFNVMDTLNHKFGEHALVSASSLKALNQRTITSNYLDAKSRYIRGLPLPYLGEVS